MVKARFFGLCAIAALVGCGSATVEDGVSDNAEDPDEIVGANAVARTATLSSHVLVRTGASDSEIISVVSRQIRPLFGAMKALEIGLSDRDANNIDAKTFVKDTVEVIDPAKPGTPVGTMTRVKFSYSDRAVVVKTLANRRAIPTSTVFTNYESRPGEIIEKCQTEHKDWGSSGIWYNFEPQIASCQSIIKAEKDKIDGQRKKLANADRQITVDERDRVFTPITIALKTIAKTETKYPDYHRLYEDGKLVIASFFGVDKLDDPRDYGAKNTFAYIRTVLAARPELKLTAVSPTTDVLNVVWKGKKIAGVTLDTVIGWILDDRGYPVDVTFADRDAFRVQVIALFRDKVLTLSAGGTVTIKGVAKPLTLEVRIFYGNEEGFGTGAVDRYKKAFGEVDVFQYTGHSHLGSGPLDSRNYTAASFANKYQILQINSCVSFNYYNEYFAMHPNGSKDLDTVTNGLPVYLEGSGISAGKFAVGMLDGKFGSYLDVLTSMKVNLPWEPGHDANRVADGESDNVFNPKTIPMQLDVKK